MTRPRLLASPLLAVAATLAGGCSPRPVAAPLDDRAAIEAALRLAPERSDLWRDLGWLRYIGGEAALADEAFTRALGQRPGEPRALLGAATVDHEAGRFAEARDGWLAILERGEAGDPWLDAVQQIAAARLEALIGEVPGQRALAERLGRLGPPGLASAETVYRVLRVRAALARRLGDHEGATAIDRRRGCPESFAVGGPFGHLPRLDLGKPLPPAPSHAVVGRRARGRGCGYAVELLRRGVGQASVWLAAPRDLTATLHLETSEPWHLVVDGETVFRQAPQDHYPPRLSVVSLGLAAGWHEVTVRLAVTGQRTEFAWALRPDDGSDLEFAETPPPRRAPPARPATARALEATMVPALPGPLGRLSDLVTALLAFRDGDSDRGGPIARRLAVQAPRFVPGLLAAAQLASEDPSRPLRFARDRARQLLGRAVEVDPLAVRARYNLATMELQDDHVEKALELLAGGPGWRMAYGRYQALRNRGLRVEAERELAAARQENPEACPPIEAALAQARDDRDLARALLLADELAVCNPFADDRAELWRSMHRPADAAREYRRLLALDPTPEGWRAALAEVLLEAGQAEAAVVELTRLAADYPRTARYWIKLADAHLAAAGPEAKARARQALLSGQTETPEAEELLRALAALGEPSPLEPYRVDGKQVIAAFARSGRRYDSPAVIVLDRTVTRVFPTGARLTLTHNIVRVQNKDGIDKWGEVQIPEGADVLLLRGVKADGTTREPEEIPGKEPVSVPDLEPGDFVEYEFVDPATPPAAFPGGFLAERFYFQSFDAPLDRTEYLLVTPAGMAVQIDRRAGAPEGRLERRGEVEVRSWVDTRKAQLLPEPQATPIAETTPSVRVASGLSLAGWRDYLADERFGVRRRSDELTTVASQIGDGVKVADPALRPAAIVDAVDLWVRRQVQPGGAVDEAASSVLASREGSRVTLIEGLLAALGIESQLWLVRPLGTAELTGELPDLEGPSEPLLRVATTPERFLDPRYRHAPTGFLSPTLRGRTGFALGDRGEAVRRSPEAQADARRITLTGTLGADGSAEVSVREVLSGWPAVEWREALDRIAEDQVRSQLEQRTLGFYFPGASLVSLTYGPRERDDEPFVVEYKFTAPRFARAEAGRLIVAAPYPALLGRRYVGVARRTTPLQLHHVAPTEIEARLQLPPKTRAVTSAAAQAAGPYGGFAVTAETSPGQLVIHSRFAMPPVRVEAARYDDFVAYAQTLDAAEAKVAEVVVE